MDNKPTLDQIIDTMMTVVTGTREQIFEICEKTRSEYHDLEQEMAEVRQKVAEIIQRTDEKEMKTQIARNRLAEVSREFRRYDDAEVRRAYEQANDLQVELAVLKQEEKQLQNRRNEIERQLTCLYDTIVRAETLVGQVTVVHNYLTGDLQEVGEIVEDAKTKQAFGLKIIQAQEEERRRVAREIHDGPAQLLANVLLRSELIERVYNEEGPDPALQEIKDVRNAIKMSLGEVRRIIYDLRPMALDDLGLIPTLKKYLGNLSDQGITGTNIRFLVLGKEKRLASDLEVALFRLVQEAVQNALKHAEAKQIVVKTELRGDRVTLVIIDDGKGFEYKETKEDCFGLMGMQERVNMLKGNMTIESGTMGGTKVRIIIPLPTGERSSVSMA